MGKIKQAERDASYQAFLAIFKQKVSAVKVLRLPIEMETLGLIEVRKDMIIYTESIPVPTASRVTESLAEEINGFLSKHNN